jgi:hypothetical protein
MARRDDQDVYDASDASCYALAKLHRPRPNRSSSAPHLRLGPCGADVNRYGRTGTEPTLDEVLSEPVIRLVMKSDNVTEDQLLRLIGIARQQMNR